MKSNGTEGEADEVRPPPQGGPRAKTVRGLEGLNQKEDDLLSIVLGSRDKAGKALSKGGEEVGGINGFCNSSYEELPKNFLVFACNCALSGVIMKHKMLRKGRNMSQALNGDIEVAGIS